MDKSSIIITTEIKKDYFLVHVTGKMTVPNIAELRKAIDAAVGQGCRHVVIDMRKVTLMDTGGSGFLLNTCKQLVLTGGILLLVSVPKHINDLLESWKIDNIIKAYATLQEAEKALAGGVEKEDHGYYMLLKLPQEFDVNAVQRVRKLIDESIESGHLKMVFDFAKTHIVTSVGIGVVLNLQKKLTGLGGRVFLVNVSADIRSILETANVQNVVMICDTMDQLDNEMI